MNPALTNLNLRPVYNHSNCPNLLADFYEPLLEQPVRYNRTTYTFTAQGLIAATDAASLTRNDRRIRLICTRNIEPDVPQAIYQGQLAAEHALLQTARRKDLLLTETANIADIADHSYLQQ